MFKQDEGKCHYNLKPEQEKHSVTVVIKHVCVCVRSRCPKFVVNEFYTVVLDENAM